MPLPKDMGKCISKAKKEFPSGRKKKGTKMSKKNVHKQHVAMCMNEEEGSMRTIVIYGGRFHPFHKGHKSVYDALAKKYGKENVYVVSSGKQAPMSSPFSFQEKTKMMQLLGVPADKIVQVKNPYMPTEITDHLDQENTSIIFAVSEKDKARFPFKPKKDGSPSYMQPNGIHMKPRPLSQTGYILFLPTIDFEVGGKPVSSASEIRQMYMAADDKGRTALLNNLYGPKGKRLKGMFDKALAITESVLSLLSYKKGGFLTEERDTKVSRTITKARILESKLRRDEFKHK